MKHYAFAALCVSSVLLVVAILGCGEGRNTAQPVVPASGQQADESSDLAERAANLAKLPDEDRKIAEEQLLCAVSSEPLGSMGPPLKVMIDDQAVFICCKGCTDKAEAEPEETLAKAKEHREKAKQATSR